MKEHLYNKEEYARRLDEGEIDTEGYYACPPEVEIEKAKNIVEQFLFHDEKVLDLGCSLGFYSFQFATNNNRVIGVDYEFRSLCIANKHKETFSNKDLLKFIQADALHLPFQEGVFDKLSNVDFIEHIILKHQSAVVKEMFRVLKPGGKLYVYTPNYTRLRIEYYLNKIKYAFCGRYFGWQEDRPYKDKPELRNHQDTLLHVGLLSFRNVKKLFIYNGFSVDQVLYTEYSIPFLTLFCQKILKAFGIKHPPFYSVFCSNSSIIFKK